MRTAFSTKTEATPERLFEVVSDLGTYPAWLDVVDAAEPIGDGVTWVVTLKARVGPFARSKRLRMVRSHDDGSTVSFERRETDGRDHSSWSMAAEVIAVADLPDRSEVSMRLDYDGSMWSGLLEGVLQAAAGRAIERLKTYVSAPL